jgi:hypothetical protein
MSRRLKAEEGGGGTNINATLKAYRKHLKAGVP